MTKNRNALSIVFIVGWLLIAYFMDRVIHSLQLYSSKTLQTMPMFTVWALFDLLLAGMAVFLFWFLLVRNAKSISVGWVCLILGLVAFLLATPFRSAFSFLFNPGPAFYQQVRDLPFLQGIVLYLSGKLYFFFSTLRINGFLADAASITIVLGAVNLLRKSRVMLPAQS